MRHNHSSDPAVYISCRHLDVSKENRVACHSITKTRRRGGKRRRIKVIRQPREIDKQRELVLRHTYNRHTTTTESRIAYDNSTWHAIHSGYIHSTKEMAVVTWSSKMVICTNQSLADALAAIRTCFFPFNPFASCWVSRAGSCGL